jgi:hypothetical protein
MTAIDSVVDTLDELTLDEEHTCEMNTSEFGGWPTSPPCTEAAPNAAEYWVHIKCRTCAIAERGYACQACLTAIQTITHPKAICQNCGKIYLWRDTLFSVSPLRK